MSGADLLTDDVEHGTTQGYAAGCRSLGGCPGKDGQFGQSCMDARRRQMGEWQYGRAVANGREVEFLAREAEERTAPPVSSPKVARAKRAQRKNQGLPAAAPVEEAVAEVEAPAAVQPEAPVDDGTPVDEEPRPRGTRALDDALRTVAEAAELQRALAGITERALRTVRAEVRALRAEAAAREAS